MKQELAAELKVVLAFVGAIWAIFLLACLVPSLNNFGLIPRTVTGLVGIPAMPYLHEDWRHIVSNTPPLLVLLMLLVGSKARSWTIVVALVLVGGGLLWLFGRPESHIGASGLIFGLIGFLIVSGILERRIVPLGVALLVGFLYGGTMLSGIVPRLGSHVSWEGHLCGVIAGGIVGFALQRQRTLTR